MGKIDLRAIQALLQLNKWTRARSGVVPGSEMGTFLAVCEREGCSLTDVAVRIDVPLGTVSRHMQRLCDIGMLTCGEDPMNHRKKILRTTEGGRKVRDQLTRLLRAGLAD